MGDGSTAPFSLHSAALSFHLAPLSSLFLLSLLPHACNNSSFLPSNPTDRGPRKCVSSCLLPPSLRSNRLRSPEVRLLKACGAAVTCLCSLLCGHDAVVKESSRARRRCCSRAIDSHCVFLLLVYTFSFGFKIYGFTFGISAHQSGRLCGY